MIEFRLKADISFMADGIDDALLRLAEHFRRVGAGDESALVQSGRVSVGRLADARFDDSDFLAAAWAEAEAALPEGWFIVAMAHSPRNHRYEFRATHPRGETSHPFVDDQGKSHRGGPMWDSLFGAGPAPAAALRALAAKLREMA